MSNDPKPRLGFRVCYLTQNAIITFIKMVTRGVTVLSPIFIATHKPAFGPCSERYRLRTDVTTGAHITIVDTDHN